MKNVWLFKFRRAHVEVLRNLVIDRMATLEGKARDPLAGFSKEQAEELQIVREIYERFE